MLWPFHPGNRPVETG